MQKHFLGGEWYINHALQVTSFVEQIVQGEGVGDVYVQQVTLLAGVFHDVGIPAALEKHGTGAGPYQEKEGEPIARDLLARLGVRPDILERVCYIVAHHHTHAAIDGLDFQILWEADALVNIPTAWGKRTFEHTLPELIEINFRTSTGRSLILQWAKEHNLL